jgi:hypothetical protein
MARPERIHYLIYQGLQAFYWNNTNPNKFSLLPFPKGEGQDEGIYITTFWHWYNTPKVTPILSTLPLILAQNLGYVMAINDT